MTASPAILRPILPALAAALLASAPQAHGEPRMWGIEGLGVREIGRWEDDVWHFEIYNHGSGSADNMILQTITALNGSRLELIGVFVNLDPISSWTLNDTHTELEVHYGIGAGQNVTFDLLFQSGCYPGPLLPRGGAGAVGWKKERTFRRNK